MKFGRYLRSLREERGWSQDEMAARSGGRLNQAFISAVETDPKRRPKRDKIEAMAELFAIDPTILEARIYASDQTLAGAERGRQTLEEELLAFAEDRPDLMDALRQIRDENADEQWDVVVRIMHRSLMSGIETARDVVAATNKQR